MMKLRKKVYNMKKLLTLSIGLLVASSAFASVHTTHNETTLFTPTFETKAQAYDAGFDISESLSAMTENQLRHELPAFADSGVRKLALDTTEVTVEEIAVNRGDIQYRATVDVNYHYDAIERD